MHQVHSVACLGDLADQAVALAGLLDQAEQEENAAAHKTGDYGIVLPVHFQFLRSRYDKAPMVKLPHAEQIAGCQNRQANRENLASGPIQTDPEIVSEKYIAYET